MAKEFIKFHGMSFNKAVLSKKTKEEFIAHEKHNFEYEGGADHMEQLWEKHLKPVTTEAAPVAPAKAAKGQA